MPVTLHRTYVRVKHHVNRRAPCDPGPPRSRGRDRDLGVGTTVTGRVPTHGPVDGTGRGVRSSPGTGNHLTRPRRTIEGGRSTDGTKDRASAGCRPADAGAGDDRVRRRRLRLRPGLGDDRHDRRRRDRGPRAPGPASPRSSPARATSRPTSTSTAPCWAPTTRAHPTRTTPAGGDQLGRDPRRASRPPTCYPATSSTPPRSPVPGVPCWRRPASTSPSAPTATTRAARRSGSGTSTHLHRRVPTFSDERLFSPIGSNVVDLTLLRARDETPGRDARLRRRLHRRRQRENTAFEFFDADGESLGTFPAPVSRRPLVPRRRLRDAGRGAGPDHVRERASSVPTTARSTTWPSWTTSSTASPRPPDAAGRRSGSRSGPWAPVRERALLHAAPTRATTSSSRSGGSTSTCRRSTARRRTRGASSWPPPRR